MLKLHLITNFPYKPTVIRIFVDTIGFSDISVARAFQSIHFYGAHTFGFIYTHNHWCRRRFRNCFFFLLLFHWWWRQRRRQPRTHSANNHRFTSNEKLPFNRRYGLSWFYYIFYGIFSVRTFIYIYTHFADQFEKLGSQALRSRRLGSFHCTTCVCTHSKLAPFQGNDDKILHRTIEIEIA